jgi:hypothetical protein
MRRTSAAISIAALLAVAIAPVAHSAVTPGATCKKLGQTTTQTGMKYTCVKSGKKQIWNKGAAIKKPASTGTTASPAPTPSPTATVAAVTYPKGPTSFDDLVENYKGIAYAAWSKSSAAIKGSTAVALPFKAVTGPKTKLAFENPARAYDLIARLYAGYESSKDFYVLSFGYDDRDWAVEQMNTLLPGSTSQWIKDVACVTRETCWGGGMHTDKNGRGLLVITTEVRDKNHLSGTLDAHEYTHTIQQNQMNQPQPWPPSGNWPPTWYLEGHANYSQYVAIYNDSFDDYTSNRRESNEGLYRDSKITSSWIQEYFVVNPPSSWFNQYDRWRQYDLGSMFIETLVAIKGPAATMEVWKQCGQGMTFKAAFEKVYGTSLDNAMPAISKAIALQLGRS